MSERFRLIASTLMSNCTDAMDPPHTKAKTMAALAELRSALRDIPIEDAEDREQLMQLESIYAALTLALARGDDEWLDRMSKRAAVIESKIHRGNA